MFVAADSFALGPAAETLHEHALAILQSDRMTHPAGPAEARGHSPRLTAAATWIVFTFLLPLVQWITPVLFRSADPPVPGDVWIRFVGTTAVAGVLAAALMHAAVRQRHGWPRSILLGIVIAMASATEVQAFASHTPAAYGVRWMLTSVTVGLVLAVVIHLLGRANRHR